jgi:hypothetical protein
MWQGMVGDMSGRYHELKHKEKHGTLNDLERNELEGLHEKLHFSRRR